MTPSIMTPITECFNAECHYAECRKYAYDDECHFAVYPGAVDFAIKMSILPMFRWHCFKNVNSY